MFGGPTIAKKYKVHQNAPFLKRKIQKLFSGMFPQALLWLSKGLSVAEKQVENNTTIYTQLRSETNSTQT